MRGIGVSVKEPLKSRRTEDLLCEWPDRIAKMNSVIPYLACQYILKYIKQRLPKGSKYKAYRMGLEVARVRTNGSGEAAYTIHINTKSRFVRQQNAHQVLLYVKPLRRSARTDPKVAILARFSPWTYESIPYMPDRTQARGIVTTKKARPEKVAKVTKQRNRERRKWAPLLARHGWREVHKDKRLKLPKNAVKIPNLALEALKLEFGLEGSSGSKSRPLWRTGINRLLKQGLKEFIRDKKYIVSPLTKPGDKLWEKWPPKTRHLIPTSQAIKYMGFEKKLGIRAKR